MTAQRLRSSLSRPAREGGRFMRRFTPVALSALLALAAMPAAQAQSLLELYEAAHGYDANYLAARALAESAQYRAEQVHALRRPNVGLSATAGRSTNETPVQDLTSNAVSAGISATQSVFNRANDKTIAQADTALAVARAELQIAEQDLIVRLSQAYFDVLAAQDTLGAANANKSAISEQLASAKRNFEVGTATITDTREAQARFDLATAQVIAAENDLRIKRIALDQQVGRTGIEPQPLAVPVALPPVQPANVDAWVAQTEDSPQVRRARAAYAIAKLETEKAQAGRLPTVDVSASYARGRLSNDGSSLAGGARAPFDYSGGSGTSNIGITLRMPLYAGHAIRNRVKETLLLEEQSRNNLEAARRGTAQATRQVFFTAQSVQAQVMALEAAESSSQLALEATQTGYRVGVRVNLDVLNAQTQLFSTRRDLARARYDVLLANLRLEQAAGTLTPEDVVQLNQLLAR